MSDEIPAASRRYTKRKRAEQEQDTRRRITEAAVQLHGTVGPAFTNVSELAKIAGVQRATVYRHFADDAALLTACSAHWRAQHPGPDPAGLAAIEDPAERLLAALRGFYAFYRSGEQMIANVRRDAATMPALAPFVERTAQAMAAVVELLQAGRPPAGAQRRAAVVALAVDFGTWQLLTRRGLSDDEAAELMAGVVACAGSRGETQ
jgi:AcrR family transcriptional regulator